MPLQATSGTASYDAFGGGVAVEPVYIEQIFQTYLYTGNNSTQVINNGIDLAGKGGLVWLKRRNAATSHVLSDSARGLGSSVYRQLFTDLTSAQNSTTTEGISSFGSGGFTLTTGSDVNALNNPYASWTFRKQPKFFDVVTYTGNGTAGRQIAHNLGSVPGCIIVKCTSAVQDWPVYHRGITDPAIYLNQTTANNAGDSKYLWGDNTTSIAPTSTVFTVGGASAGTVVNGSGQTYVAYLFAHNAGGFGLTGTDNVISCGSYTGTGAVGNKITLGYEPQWLLIKRTDTANSWYLFDTMRGLSLTQSLALLPNGTNSDLDYGSSFQLNADGVTQNNANSAFNASGGTYIYIAIRRGPMKVPTSGTSVFSPLKSTTTFTAGNTTGTLLSDWMWGRPRLSEGSLNWFQSSRLTPRTMAFNGATAEDATQYVGFDTQTGVRWVNTWTSTAGNYGSWYFRRAPNFFDEVCYTGTGVAMTVNHNLGVTPELMIVKGRSGATGWVVYTAGTGATKYMRLDLANSAATLSAAWNNTAPTSSVFTVGDNSSVNTASATYVAYLFATCAGVSKVGSYTGNGSTQTINCGFTGGARFVLIKSTTAVESWHIFDTARGMVAGTDPRLRVNTTDSELNSNWVYTATTGFEIVTSDAAVNGTGQTYIFLAIA